MERKIKSNLEIIPNLIFFLKIIIFYNNYVLTRWRGEFDSCIPIVRQEHVHFPGNAIQIQITLSRNDVLILNAVFDCMKSGMVCSIFIL